MKLYLVRHGIAEEAAASLNDFDRSLTNKGRKRTREVGQVLASKREVPSLILTSPLVRAVQTAEVLALTLEPDEVTVRQELAPGGDAADLVRELVKKKVKSVMLVGHEPSMSELAVHLVGEAGWSRTFLKSMVLGLRVPAQGQPEVRFVLDPKSLELKSSS